jgi:hypothetical protein
MLPGVIPFVLSVGSVRVHSQFLSFAIFATTAIVASRRAPILTSNVSAEKPSYQME